MTQQQTPTGVPYFQGTDAPAGFSQQQTLAQFIDANPGIGSFTQAQINAFALNQMSAGRIVFNTTTSKLQRSDGANWENLPEPIQVQATPPTTFASGDSWMDTSVNA